MTRTIKVSEVRPGMEVQWTSLGITRRCTGEVVDAGSPRDGVNLRTSEGGAVHIPGDAEVTVLTEPQPEEPTAFGARVVADGMLFVRADDDANPWRHLRAAMWVNWRDVCALGEVTVIDADPSWTVPEQATEAPGVPERIEKWPEDDSALRKYKWVDRDADTWTWTEAQAKWECRNQRGECYMARSCPSSWFGPWTRATDA